MQETIHARLEASRKDLLDLGLRNPLLNYKIPKGRGLQIVQEKSAAIFDILVRQNKAMTFLGRPSKDGAPEEIELPELTEQELEDAYMDTRLQTNEPDKQLQAKILNTYYFAKTSIEEQGVNILYLALGMLSWFEDGNTEDRRLAPLVLVPVSLERSSAQERFRLRYTGSEIGANLSLQAKMMAEFSITIPDLGEVEELDFEAYCIDIEKRITQHPAWSVEKDTIHLGFFSFGKFMIYHDLDSSKWPDSNKPFDNKIIISLFGNGFREEQPTYTEEHNLDTETESNNLFQVVDADSSQVLAMLAVHEGRNMVIQGPPGTGKSQTITNLIANAVGQGKKVLFVAEKLAALEVVKRRLDNIHLGEACLELHSHKANKKVLHEELKRILDLNKPKLVSLEQEVLLLEKYRESLNEYCSAINTGIKQSGLSAQKVIGFLLQTTESCKGLAMRKIIIPGIEHWKEGDMKQAEATADTIQATLQNTGIPAGLLFWGTGRKVLLPHEKETLATLLATAIGSCAALTQHCADAARQLQQSTPHNIKETLRLVETAQLAAQSPGLAGIAVHDSRWWQQKQDIFELLQTGKRLAEIHAAFDNILIPEAWGQDVMEIRQNLQAHGSKWYKFLIGSYNKSNKHLAGFCKGAPVKDLGTKMELIDAITEAARLEKTLSCMESLASTLFGSQWQKQRSDWANLGKVAAYMGKDLPPLLLNYLDKHDEASVAAGLASALEQAMRQFQFDIKSLLSALLWNELTNFTDAPFGSQYETLSNWQLRLPEIFVAIQWNNLADSVEAAGHAFIFKHAVDWPEAKSQLKTALQKAWYEYLVEQAMAQPALRRFERAGHEEAVQKFKTLDIVNLQYNRARVALKHWQTVPRQEAGGQVNILKSEFNRKARHMPIRKLVQDAGLAIQAIKPVFMMSPMSIANFLPPGSIEFDIVIFDEASQVRPVDALGALLRAKQLVVVGDTKQLPPTSFFDKMNTDTEDEDNITADMQSILGMCDGQGVPERMLRWHYRSRHESLISLSNHEFYENRLVIFPSSGSRQRMGLLYHHLPQTVYDSGKTRTNAKEAEAVADAVMEHAAKNPKQTLGVVAFSTAQMQAIQYALEIRRRKQPELEGYFRSHPHEPFVVKNLENVQGDERDVIYISIGYGRTEDGKVPQRFGPLNNNGGERRLNVLITRAKYRCEVFTNMTSEDIAVTPASKFGIRALKSFLYYAYHGKFDSQEEAPISLQTPFEDYVAAKLESRGYTVRKKVGMEGFYIDMAIVDDEYPGRYILGIDCDGHAYAAAKSARDRDRLRMQVLEMIGWKMYRVWSMDWLYHPESELERLVAAIQKAKELIAQGDIEIEAYETEIAELARETAEEPASLLPLYACAELSSQELTGQEFHLHPLGKLSGWLEQVVAVESPIHFDEMAYRLTRAAGIGKVGSRIRECLLQASRYAEQTGGIKIKGDFLWLKNMETPVIRDRSSLPPGSKRLQFISPEELCLAVKKVVEESLAIQPEAALPFIAKLFGFARVTEEMRKDLLLAVNIAVENGLIKKEGDLLKAQTN